MYINMCPHISQGCLAPFRIRIPIYPYICLHTDISVRILPCVLILVCVLILLQNVKTREGNEQILTYTN